MAKMHIKLENPKTYTALLLFFGCIFAGFGTVFASLTANSDLSQAGWIMIAGSACLWVFEVLRKGKH